MPINRRDILIVGHMEKTRCRLAYVLSIRLGHTARVKVLSHCAELDQTLSEKPHHYNAVLVHTKGMFPGDLTALMEILQRHDMIQRTVCVSVHKDYVAEWQTTMVVDDLACIADAVLTKARRKRGPRRHTDIPRYEADLQVATCQ